MSAKFWHQDVRVSHLQKKYQDFCLQKFQNLYLNLTLPLTDIGGKSDWLGKYPDGMSQAQA